MVTNSGATFTFCSWSIMYDRYAPKLILDSELAPELMNILYILHLYACHNI